MSDARNISTLPAASEQPEEREILRSPLLPPSRIRHISQTFVVKYREAMQTLSQPKDR